MTEFTKEWIAKVREQIKFISPLPWTACSCGKCGSISNGTDAIAKATMGNWGDDYPDIRRIGGSVEGKFETFMNQFTYGNIPKETGNINAQYIAEACTNYPKALDHIERLQARVRELEQERRWIPVRDYPSQTGWYRVITNNGTEQIREYVREPDRDIHYWDVKDGEWIMMYTNPPLPNHRRENERNTR